jgi:hypothetical protein
MDSRQVVQELQIGGTGVAGGGRTRKDKES